MKDRDNRGIMAVMEKMHTTKEYRKLTEMHRGLLNRVKSAYNSGSLLTKEISDTADDLLFDEVLKVLRDIPVAQLNRERKGIRVKALTDHGYETAADLSHATVKEISDLGGIGDTGAKMIMEEIMKIIAETKKFTRIRITLDDRSAKKTRLIRALYRYRNLEKDLKDCAGFLKDNEKTVTALLADAETGTSLFKRLFSSREKKETAEQAYKRLLELFNGTYTTAGEGYAKRIGEVFSCTEETAWNDFADNAAAYFTTLEAFTGGFTGNEESESLLPKTLAEQVNAYEIHTEGMRCELRRYQSWGVKYILHQKKVLLGDEMGLGKTVQAIAAMVSLRNEGNSHFLVICPASVTANWCREVTAKSDLNVFRLHGSHRDEMTERWIREGGCAVTTYETASALNIPETLQIALVTADEAHYIKNPEAQRTKTVLKICKQTERILLMTGTAMENRADEMIALIRILSEPVSDRLEEIKYLSAQKQFRREAASVYLRRKRDEVLGELPDLIENSEWLQLNEAEEEKYAESVFSGTYNDVRRVSWNVDHMRDSTKAARMMELIYEAEAEGRKVIVFSFFLDTIRRVTELLGNHCVNPITGSVPAAERQQIIDEFEMSPPGTVLPAQIISGGTGVNIQSANVVIICEPQLKPSTETQAISRAYRMGQTRNVLVYRLLAEDTADERIMEILEEKKRLFHAFAEQSEAAARKRNAYERNRTEKRRQYEQIYRKSNGDQK